MLLCKGREWERPTNLSQAQGNTFSHKAQKNVLFQTFIRVQKILKQTNAGKKKMGNNSSMKNKSIFSSGKIKSHWENSCEESATAPLSCSDKILHLQSLLSLLVVMFWTKKKEVETASKHSLTPGASYKRTVQTQLHHLNRKQQWLHNPFTVQRKIFAGDAASSRQI